MKKLTLFLASMFLVFLIANPCFADLPVPQPIIDAAKKQQQAVIAKEMQVMLPDNFGTYEFKFEDGDLKFSGGNDPDFTDIGNAISFVISDNPTLTKEFIDSVNRATGGNNNISTDMNPPQVKSTKQDLTKILEKKLNSKYKQIYDNLKKLYAGFSKDGDKNMKVISFKASSGVSTSFSTKIKNKDSSMLVELSPNYDFNKKISFLEKDGIKTIIVDGKADVISLDGNYFGGLGIGIEKATLKSQNGKIIFADFISPKARNYRFEYNEKLYGFSVEDGGRIKFDPLNKEISGEKIKSLEIDGSVISSVKQFSVKLTDTGGISEVDLPSEGKFKDAKSYIYSSKEDLKIFLDGTKDFSKVKNAVSIVGEKEVYLKGQVSMDGSLIYNGKSEDALTIFTYPGESSNGDFNVRSGDSEFGSAGRKISVKDGESKLIENKNNIFSKSFTFTHTTKEGIRIEGFINEEGNSGSGEYTITVHKKDGTTSFISKKFSEISALALSNLQLVLQNERFEQERVDSAQRLKDAGDKIDQMNKLIEKLKKGEGKEEAKDFLKKQIILLISLNADKELIGELQGYLDGLDFDSTETIKFLEKNRNYLELQKIGTERERYALFGEGRNDYEEKLKDFLKKDILDISLKVTANSLLGEVLLRKMASINRPIELEINYGSRSSVPSEVPDMLESFLVRAVRGADGIYKVTSYSRDGGKTFKSINEEYQSGFFDMDIKTRTVIEELQKKGGSVQILEDMAKRDSSFTITNKGGVKDSAESALFDKYYSEAKTLFESSKELAKDNIAQTALIGRNLGILESLAGNKADAQKLFEATLSQGLGDEFNLESYRLMAKLSAGINTRDISDKLQNFAIARGKNSGNLQVVQENTDYKIELITSLSKKIRSEDPLQGTYARFGNPQTAIGDALAGTSFDEFGKRWSDAWLNTPKTLWYGIWYFGKEDKLASSVESEIGNLYTRQNQLLFGAQGMELLLRNSQDINTFLGKDIKTQIDTMADLSGSNYVIRAGEFEKHLREISSGKDVADLSAKERYQVIKEWKGTQAADLDGINYIRAMSLAQGTVYSVKNNPAYFLIANDGKKESSGNLVYSGEQSLDSAFEANNYIGSMSTTIADQVLNYVPSARTTLIAAGTWYFGSGIVGGLAQTQTFVQGARVLGTATTWGGGFIGTSYTLHQVSPVAGEAFDDFGIMLGVLWPMVANRLSKPSLAVEKPRSVSEELANFLETAKKSEYNPKQELELFLEQASKNGGEYKTASERLNNYFEEISQTSKISKEVELVQRELGNIAESISNQEFRSIERFAEALGRSEFAAKGIRQEISGYLRQAVDQGEFIGSNPDGTFSPKNLESFWNPKGKPLEVLNAYKVIDPIQGKFEGSMTGDYYYAIKKDGSFLLKRNSPVPLEGENIYAVGKLKLRSGEITDIELPKGLDGGDQRAFADFTYEALYRQGYIDSGDTNAYYQLSNIGNRKSIGDLLRKYSGEYEDEYVISGEQGNPKAIEQKYLEFRKRLDENAVLDSDGRVLRLPSTELSESDIAELRSLAEELRINSDSGDSALRAETFAKVNQLSDVRRLKLSEILLNRELKGTPTEEAIYEMHYEEQGTGYQRILSKLRLREGRLSVEDTRTLMKYNILGDAERPFIVKFVKGKDWGIFSEEDAAIYLDQISSDISSQLYSPSSYGLKVEPVTNEYGSVLFVEPTRQSIEGFEDVRYIFRNELGAYKLIGISRNNAAEFFVEPIPKPSNFVNPVLEKIIDARGQIIKEQLILNAPNYKPGSIVKTNEYIEMAGGKKVFLYEGTLISTGQRVKFIYDTAGHNILPRTFIIGKDGQTISVSISADFDIQIPVAKSLKGKDYRESNLGNNYAHERNFNDWTKVLGEEVKPEEGL